MLNVLAGRKHCIPGYACRVPPPTFGLHTSFEIRTSDRDVSPPGNVGNVSCHAEHARRPHDALHFNVALHQGKLAIRMGTRNAIKKITTSD